MDGISIDSHHLTKTTNHWSRMFDVNNVEVSRPKNFHQYKTFEKPHQWHCTGSSYIGSHDPLGFAGYGVYIYPHGVKYEGHFKDGQFDGEGTLIYPNGNKIKGMWIKGRLHNHTFQFKDGMEINKEPWSYLEFPNRCLTNEKIKSTQKLPTIEKLPMNCYYTGDGYFDPVSKVVLNFKRKNMRIVSKMEEAKIIKDFPHKMNDTPVGYSPELYEVWFTGRNQEIEEMKKLGEDEEQDKSTIVQDNTDAISQADEDTSIYSFIFKILIDSE